jgi:hypothetical protein
MMSMLLHLSDVFLLKFDLVSAEEVSSSADALDIDHIVVATFLIPYSYMSFQTSSVDDHEGNILV